jgi:hypothetical protein
MEIDLPKYPKRNKEENEYVEKLEASMINNDVQQK